MIDKIFSLSHSKSSQNIILSIKFFIIYCLTLKFFAMNALDFFHMEENTCSDHVRVKVEKLAHLVAKLKTDGYADTGVEELYNRYLRAETPAEKAKFYFEDLFDSINRWGVTFHRGYVIKAVQRGEFPSWIACFPGVLIKACGNYKETCETLRNFIHQFKDRERCFEISEVNEETDELKSKVWELKKSVLWHLPNRRSLEGYAQLLAEQARQFLLIFGYVPKVYVYESSETGIWVKSICKESEKEVVWAETMKILAEALGLEDKKLFSYAVLWRYKQDAENFEKLPDEVVAVRKKEQVESEPEKKKFYGAEMMVPGVCTCDGCGSVIPMTGFESGGDHLCANCIRLERGEIKEVQSSIISGKYPIPECSPTDEGRPCC